MIRKFYWALLACLVLVTAIYCVVFFRINWGGEAAQYLSTMPGEVLVSLAGLRFSLRFVEILGIGLCVVYSLMITVMVLVRFRTTSSHEIFFFAFFILGTGMEVARLVEIYYSVAGASQYWQDLIAKTIIFSRTAGLLAFFMSSATAAGLKIPRLWIPCMVIIVVSVYLASTTLQSSIQVIRNFRFDQFFSNPANVLEIAMCAVIIANFIYAAVANKEKKLGWAAMGAAILLVGHFCLTRSWNPYIIGGGFVALVSGSLVFVTSLLKFYLWQ